MSEDKKHRRELNELGFTLIELLIAMAIFSIMFLSLTSAIWSATSNFRKTANVEELVLSGQNALEWLSLVDINNVTSPSDGTVLTRGDEKIKFRVVSSDDNFKTIVMEVYNSADDILLPSELRMKTYYRRMKYQ